MRHEKLLGQTAFFKAMQKELLGQQFSQKVMTEGFLTPNAKTAFFKAFERESSNLFTRERAHKKQNTSYANRKILASIYETETKTLSNSLLKW